MVYQYETRNERTVPHNLDGRISLRIHECRFRPGDKWKRSQSLQIGEEGYATAFFGDALNDVKFRKNEIVFVLPHENIERYGDSDDWGLYRPVLNVLKDIKRFLGDVPKGLKITVEVK